MASGATTRPQRETLIAAEMKRLRQEGRSYREIAKRLGVSHASVIRLLRLKKRP